MNFKKQYYLILFFLIGVISSPVQSQSSNPLHQAVDNYMKETMRLHQVPGAALAVIKNGKVIHQQYYGKASLEQNTLVNEKSMFRIYSTTKLTTVTGIFQLIEQGKLSQEDAIGKYLPHLPATWKAVKVKHLLTHSSGIPDLIRFPGDLSEQDLMAKLVKQPMEFPKGKLFYYNQTNYWLLAQIIAKVSQTTFEEFILKNQFMIAQNNPKTGVFFSSRSTDNIPNRIVKYDYKSQKQQYKKSRHNAGKYGHPGNGLNITLNAMIKWGQKLSTNELLKPATKSLMWTPFKYNNNKDKFLRGWGIYNVNGQPSYGFTGGGVSGFRRFPKDKITIIFMSNGYRYFPIHNRLINHIAGLVSPNLQDKAQLLEQQIIQAFLKQKTSQAIKTYKKIKNQLTDVSFEGLLNSLGYTFLSEGKTQNAIAIFELNTKEHPTSGNVYDSLGEAYFVAQKYSLAKKNYTKALELTPNSRNAQRMLQKIKSVRKK